MNENKREERKREKKEKGRNKEKEGKYLWSVSMNEDSRKETRSRICVQPSTSFLINCKLVVKGQGKANSSGS
jgi:hypothetical protein